MIEHLLFSEMGIIVLSQIERQVKKQGEKAMAKKVTSFSLGQEVIGTFNGIEYPGTIEDKAGNEYSVRTSLWREKKRWQANELVAVTYAHKENGTMAVNTKKSTKKAIDNTLVNQEQVTLVPVNLAKTEEEATVVAVAAAQAEQEKKF